MPDAATPSVSLRAAHARFRLRDGIVRRAVGAKVFVYSPEGRMAVADNATASHVIAQLARAGDEGATAAQLGASLASAFDVKAEDTVSDVEALLESLLAEGLVARV